MLPLHSFSYSIPYLILVLIILVFTYFEQNKKYRNVAIWVMASILILFFGLRGFVQTDWNLYYYLFEKTPSIFEEFPYTPKDKDYEPLYMIYTQILKTIMPNYFVWIFFNTLVDISIMTVVFKRYSKSVAWSWIFFLCFSGLVVEFNLARNVKAILLIMLALPYIQERKLLKFLAVLIVATMFHFSSILYLPAYFVLNRNWGRITPVFLFLMVNIVFFFKVYPTTMLLSGLLGSSNAFLENGVSYLTDKKVEYGLTFGYVERTLIFILTYIFQQRLVKQNPYNLIFCNCIYIYYTVWYLFSDVQVFVERIPILFVFGYWILLPNMMSLAKGSIRRAINVAAILFVMMKVTVTTNHILYYYDSIVTGIRPIPQRYNDFVRYSVSQKI